jgi:hypothetical protein
VGRGYLWGPQTFAHKWLIINEIIFKINGKTFGILRYSFDLYYVISNER